MCKYCEKKANNKKIEDVDNDKEDGMYVAVLGDRPTLIVELDAIDNDGYKAEDYFQINFCPMCGRKLVIKC